MMAMLARSCSTPILAMLTPSMTMAPLSSSCAGAGHLELGSQVSLLFILFETLQPPQVQCSER